MLIQQEQQQQQVPSAGIVSGKKLAKSNAEDTNAADNISTSSAENNPRSKKFLSFLIMYSYSMLQVLYFQGLI